MKDPRTLPAWATLKRSERLVQLAAYLCDELKVQEEPHGSNRGVWVDKFNAVAGLVGSPWCLSSQMWLLLECGVPEKNLPPKAIRASTQMVAAWAKEHGKTVAHPQRGDIFIHLNSDHKTGHAGLVIEPRDLDMRTIEGNTNDDGSREGYEVCRAVRPLTYPGVYVRLY